MGFQEDLRREFAPFGVLGDDVLARLEAHYQLMMRWNQRINLTRIERLDEAVRFHYAESLFLAGRIPGGVKSVVDVGSGPGFPGIPVAIFRPDLEVTLLESSLKKVGFLREAAVELPNTKVLGSRMEHVSARFDLVIARAVSPKDVVGAGLSERWLLAVSTADAPKGSQIEKLPWGDDRVLASRL